MSDLQTLPTWLDPAAAALSGATPPAQTVAAALPGLARAQSLTALQRLQVLQESDLCDSGFAGEPVALAWRQFLRGHGPSTLVIDAAGFDSNALGAVTILDSAPWLLAEGVLIAAGLRNSLTVELRLPPELSGHALAFLNAVDAMRALAQIAEPRRQVEIKSNCLPSPWSHGSADDRSRLIHTPETWCRIALLFAGAPKLDALLVTLRRGTKLRGLVELQRSANLRRQIEEWGGGVKAEGQDKIVLFDDGLGGVLPLCQADLTCDPLSLTAAGVTPSPSTLMAGATSTCIVKQTRSALYRHWQIAEGEDQSVRALLMRAARLVTEITIGRGEPGHLAALDDLALELSLQGLAAAWPLGSALRYYREQWHSHIRGESCPEGACLVRNAAPCHRACPARIDIPSFMAHLGHGDHRATVEVIRRDNPLPLTCGLVCPAPCESACVRGAGNGAVFIRPLKAAAAEQCLAEGGYPTPSIAPATGKRVGIVGSGPAGLTAAFFLRTQGHEVDVLEEQEKAGGMLRYGIPAYRLPPDLLEQEIDQIRALGVTIRTGVKVDKLDDFRPAYDAVLLGLGTQRSRLIPIDGVEQTFVLGGIDFLRSVRDGDAVQVGPRVVVIGGGNVAIDVALTALRQGAEQVDMVCLEKRREMPASPHEIELAVAEGVQLHPGWGPLRIQEDGKAIFQFCTRLKDDSGRFNPTFDVSRLLELESDHVILAVGQATDVAMLQGSEVEVNRGYIVTDAKTMMTKAPGVFAAGDIEHGPRTCVEAIRSGKIAAAAMDAWLRGEPMDSAAGDAVRRAEVAPLPTTAADRTQRRRSVMPEKSVEEVLAEGNYVRIEEGLSASAARDETGRCLRCDICLGCGLCMAACSEMGIEALRMERAPGGRLAYVDFTRPAQLCIGCGACTQVCPTGAIRLEDVDGVRRTIITGTVVREQPLLVCIECGTPTQTPAHRDFVRQRLPDQMAAHLERELCPACARRRADRPVAVGSVGLR